MSIDRWVTRFAGTVVPGSLLPAHFVSPNWTWLTAFVGATLLRSTFTGLGPLAIVLKRMGIPTSQAPS